MDKKLLCSDCGNEFIFTKKDQEFFAKKGFTDPKRCIPCRRRKKTERMAREAREISK